MINLKQKKLLSSKQFKHVILGGTFDHFHLGHQKLLEVAFEKGEKIAVGITQEELLKDKLFFQTIESYTARKKSVSEFLAKKGWLKRAKLISISDIYGTTLKDKNIDAIVVSQITKKNAQKINQKRQKIGFLKMEMIIIPDVLADDGKLITSERIRLGEIDRNGTSYQLLITNYKKEVLILPKEMRQELRKPLGRVFRGKDDQLEKTTKQILYCFKSLKFPVAIAVGDVIVSSLLKLGFNPEVKIIDLRTRRKEFSISNFQFSLNFQLPVFKKKYRNNPGTINIGTALKLKTLVQKGGGWLVVNGEEDLLALPAILFAPLGALVLYGQWDLGVVVVEVTEEIKNQVKTLLMRFA